MAVDIKKYSGQLRKLCEDYYCNNITYIEYRSLRNGIFDDIDNEQGLGKDCDIYGDGDPVNDALLFEQETQD